jgi:hypothetical protein
VPARRVRSSRTGIGARAAGSDGEQPAGVDRRDRAAARADGVHVEHGKQDREPRHVACPPPRQAIARERDVGRGPAHVERERGAEAGLARGAERRAQTRGRPRQELPHRLAQRRARRHPAAVRQHDLEARTAGLQQRVHVTRDARLEVRIHDRGREALVFPNLGTQLGRRRHRHAELARRACQAPLVAGRGVAVQQTDHQRLGTQTPRARDRAPDLGIEERHLGSPVWTTAGAHADASFPRDERRHAPGRERIQVRTILASDLEQVLEAAVGQHHDPRTLALEQGVGRDGRAMAHQRGAARAESSESFEHRALRRARSRGNLERDPPGRKPRYEGRERPAGVHADHGRGAASTGAAPHVPALRRRRQ